MNVLASREAIAGVLNRTPVLRSEALDTLAGARLWFKAEGLQVTGSFKVRGAWNRIRSFTPEELSGDADLRLYRAVVETAQVHVRGSHPVWGSGIDRRVTVQLG